MKRTLLALISNVLIFWIIDGGLVYFLVTYRIFDFVPSLKIVLSISLLTFSILLFLPYIISGIVASFISGTVSTRFFKKADYLLIPLSVFFISFIVPFNIIFDFKGVNTLLLASSISSVLILLTSCFSVFLTSRMMKK